MKVFLFFCAWTLALGAIAVPVHAAPPADKGAASGDDADTDSATSQMKAELKHVADVISTAKKPEELDELLASLQKYQGGNFNPGLYTREDQELFQQLSGALEFTKVWQEYLTHLNWGQPDQAKADLSNLCQGNLGFNLMPRSKILALLAGAPKPSGAAPVAEMAPEVVEVQKIADGIDSLEGLEPALKQLYAMAPGNPVAENFAKSLAPMVEIYADLKGGLPTSVNMTFMGDTSGPGVSVKVNSLLLNFIFQHYFDTYAGAPPADGETPTAYTARVKADALARQDWPLLRKALTAHAYLVRNVAGAGGSNEADDETSGLNTMIDGINQEAAQQYALAVASYQNALRSGSLDLPAKFIGERLEGIKREHGAEYDAGMASFLSPPMPYYPGMNPAYYNAMLGRPSNRPGFPGTPGNPTSHQSPVLSVPGTKSSPPPEPAPPPAPVPASTNAAPAAVFPPIQHP
jgi:hypothetical protein